MSFDQPEREPTPDAHGSGHDEDQLIRSESQVEPRAEPFVESPTETESIRELEAGDIQTDSMLRLHPSSLAFDLITHGKSYLFPALIALFSAARGGSFGIYIAAIIFVPAILSSIFRYFTFRYSIQNQQLVVTKGLIFRSVRTVPVSRIQNLDFVQNILHRMLGVAEVRVETASGTEAEATLRVLSLEQMDKLRSEIFDLQSAKTVVDSAFLPAVNDSPDVDGMTGGLRPASIRDAGESLLEIPTAWLLRAGLASNRGMLMLGIAFGAMFQFDFEDRFDFRRIWRFLPQLDGSIGGILTLLSGLIGLLLLLRLLGVGWFILRFFGYKLKRHGEDLRISCGLFTKVSATVPRGRIQFISIHRNLIMRWMGYSSLRIETAGGAGKDNENATTTVSRRWFVPVIPDHQVAPLLCILRPGLVWDESSLDFQPLSSRASTRMMRLSIILGALLVVVGLGFSRPWGFLPGVLLLPVFIWWAIKKSKSMRYAWTKDGLVYRSGVLNRKTSLTFFEKIQGVSVRQSPFDRRWKMAQLAIDTAAAGPAEHVIVVGYLDEEFAKTEFQVLRDRTATHQPVFG